MTGFRDHRYFRELATLNLPADDYAVAGSGPLFARGWIDDPGDIDVIARGEAWQTVCRIGSLNRAPISGSAQVSLFHGHLEFFDEWFPPRWRAAALIDEADVIDGIRFIRLEVVEATKRMLRRPRDLAQLAVLAARRRPRH
ncbi:MAG: hypothetical protein HOV71_30975 [Hamadaea sp.]|nr:hypothetical protein [Hamadaea sp.]NUR52570.1 hypothetical protein [Hamadaea sp.]NUT05126.1 hypothetical protein [Hamadaea sp.]